MHRLKQNRPILELNKTNILNMNSFNNIKNVRRKNIKNSKMVRINGTSHNKYMYKYS